MMNILPLALGGAALYWWLNRSTPFKPQAVTGGVTQKPWITEVTKVTGTGDQKVTTVNLYAPAGSWGPHGQLLVATYQQTGSDKSSRITLGYGKDAVPEMITAAGQDFGIQKPPGAVSGSRPGADIKLPLYSRQGGWVGDAEIHHDEGTWKWAARSPTGRVVADGSARTPATAISNARARAISAARG